MSQLALYGGEKMIDKSFPWPIWDEVEMKAVHEVINSGKWGNPDCDGVVEQFEMEFADFCGSRYAISVVNGSISLRLTLMAFGVGPGDEVIVPPYTFITTASSVIECNAVPVFADIDPETYCLDPAAVEKAITPKTKAIVPVHFGGQACNMKALLSICKKYNLYLLEDAAHAHGAEYEGRKLGSIGHAGSFSFQSSKNLTAGEGGVVVTDDAELYHKIRSLRNVGRIEGGAWYDHYFAGSNYRLGSMQAGLLSAQLKRLDAQTRTRNGNGLLLNELLKDIPGITPLKRGFGETLHCYHLYVFKFDGRYYDGLTKEEFVNRLVAEGVPCFKGYPHPLYRQPLFQERNFMCYTLPDSVDYTSVNCPEAEKACHEAVWILQNGMLGTADDIELFSKAIRKVLELK